jgi:UDP-N-acetylglucosamine acyltransferase
MANTIHPSAVVEDGAKLGADVRIGPFCHIGPEVVLGDGVELMSHAVVAGATTLGAACKVYPHAVLGCGPQNTRHRGGRTTLTIGHSTVIREGVTMHTGTDTARGATEVGHHGMFLAYSHVSHDSRIGNHVTFANNVMIGGHCEIGDHVILGGGAALHQFVRIGHHAFVGGLTGIEGDLIPYGIAVGDRARLGGLNIVGMKRSGMARADIHALRHAYRMLFDPAAPLQENAGKVAAEFAGNAAVEDIVAFVRSGGKRAFTTPASRAAAGDDDSAA